MIEALVAARRRALWPLAPAVLSWAVMFGYQWLFALGYHGPQRTVFSYYSGILGDGVFLPAVNVAAFSVLRALGPQIRWRRLPLYAFLGTLTALAAFLMQAHLDMVNWSMPSPFEWSAVGRFHFLVMSAEIAYLYLAMASAINNWARLRAELSAWRAFWVGWAGLASFALTLVADYHR